MNETRKLGIAAAVCLVLAGVAAATPARIIYVDDDAGGANVGTSWGNAHVYLQDALADAASSAKPVEIHVAQGLYKPDRSWAYPDDTRDRLASFSLLDGVAIVGGFAGVGAPDPNARDIALYETVLSGDLEGDDAPVLDPCELLVEPTRAENSCTVVEAGVCSRSAVLDGFTVASGNIFAACTRRVSGGGLYVAGDYSDDGGEFACPSIRNCTFVGNIGYNGGAVGVVRGYPELVNCTFTQNAVSGLGGAVYTMSLGSSSPENTHFLIKECAFNDNCAGNKGGAAYILHTRRPSTVIEDCSFTGNVANSGGAIYTRGPKTTIVDTSIRNTRFIHNKAHEAGGAVYFTSLGGVAMRFCTLFGNVAGVGSAVACLEPVYENFPAPSATIINTILWDGGDEIAVSEHVQMDVTYSNIQGNWPGEGNIDVDPLFADPGHWDPNDTPDDPNDDFWVDGDYHLKSQAGRWDPKSESRVKDDITSPCIDAGDPNSPVGAEPFPNGGRVNMGAYGGTAEASKSYFGEPACETIIAGDINGD